MQRFRFPIAVALTSLSIVAVLVVGGVFLAGSALAGGLWAGGHGFGPWSGGHGGALPPELAGLGEVPAAERFAHFRGVQVSLTDKDNRPLTIAVTPGTATAASATSLTMAANDGATKTFSLDDQTVILGQSTQGGATDTRPSVGKGDRVVVVTFNGSPTAHAVMLVPAGGFGPWGAFGH